ncbi:hypothetical protein [Gluconacetobacter sacchari]|uniref:Uncharacterized protein n=1 Tax=Gluconacetobacter sacchari TaxID=92759 RepID=A0A7W4ICL0_9PROT|nr:hypothetical protein [Gluconacetobacter sacchari]MBB2160388.1 hypothetical protein [Gluconacetobacter sacchari]
MSQTPAQACKVAKNYTSDRLQAAANGYQPATFSAAGNVLDSLMPKTQSQWIGLAATMAAMVTPVGETVVLQAFSLRVVRNCWQRPWM